MRQGSWKASQKVKSIIKHNEISYLYFNQTPIKSAAILIFSGRLLETLQL